MTPPATLRVNQIMIGARVTVIPLTGAAAPAQYQGGSLESATEPTSVR